MLFKFDFIMVDVGLMDDGLIVFEVFVFGGFKGVFEGVCFDVVGFYVDYIIREF